VVSSPALQRRMIRGWTPRRLRHLQFQPTPRRNLLRYSRGSKLSHFQARY